MKTPAQLGIEIAAALKWDGQQIIEAFLAALTDANFHEEKKKIENLLKSEK